jgi:oligopeptide/dipeptide ABC transporter ATP-binding protein
MPNTLLAVRGLKTYFATPKGEARAVDGVDLSLDQGETVALVGESGCGKTMVALSILGLVPDPPGRIVGGELLFKGRDLRLLDPEELRAVRGNQISMIFQEPMTSLNPVFTIGEQIAEIYRLHLHSSAAEALDAAAEMLDLVGFSNPRSSLKSYPHELSGGMRQRVVIAMALACSPDLILADEPTTALDVTIQAQILRLMLDLQEKKGASILLITHDLGIVAQSCKRVYVMYAGKVVEAAPVGAIFREPLHPYTRGLLASLPVWRSQAASGKRPRLTPILGTVPELLAMPTGCAFHPRCVSVFDRCRLEAPPLLDQKDGRSARCWLYA